MQVSPAGPFVRRARLVRLPGILCAALAFAPSFVSETHAQTSGAMVQAFVPDARSQGMGRAFTAVARGPWTVWWNPGALPLQRDNDVGYSEMQLLPGVASDVRTHSVAAVGARDGFGLGAHYARLDYGKSIATDPQGHEIGEDAGGETAAAASR